MVRLTVSGTERIVNSMVAFMVILILFFMIGSYVIVDNTIKTAHKIRTRLNKKKVQQDFTEQVFFLPYRK